MEEKPIIKEEHLRMILEMSLLCNSQLKLDNLLELVLDNSIEVVQAEAGTLWMKDDDCRLVSVVVRGPNAEQFKKLYLRPGEGIAGQVVEKNEPYLSQDVKKSADWSNRFDEATHFVTSSMLCIPLQGRKETIGCMQLINKRDGQPFTEYDMEVAMGFSGQAAIALENSRLYTWQGMLLNSLIRVLASSLDSRDPYTHGHSERVSKYSLLIGEEMNLSDDDMDLLEKTSLLHDIGKIGVRDRILLQEGPLGPDEWLLMQKHAEIGANILATVEPKHMAGRFHEGALYHHEKFDGSGYPHKIKGDDIPLFARIIAVADTFDAMTSDRPYRKGLSFDKAFAEIELCSGAQFDCDCAAAFLRAMHKEGAPQKSDS